MIIQLYCLQIITIPDTILIKIQDNVVKSETNIIILINERYCAETEINHVYMYVYVQNRILKRKMATLIRSKKIRNKKRINLKRTSAWGDGIADVGPVA